MDTQFRENMYYYRTQHGAECDLTLTEGLNPVTAIEIKYSDMPSLRRGFYESLKDVNIAKAYTVTPETSARRLGNR